MGTKEIISENARRIDVKPEQIHEKDIKEFIEINLSENCQFPNRVVIGGCDKETKIEIYLQNSFSTRNDRFNSLLK